MCPRGGEDIDDKFFEDEEDSDVSDSVREAEKTVRMGIESSIEALSELYSEYSVIILRELAGRRIVDAESLICVDEERCVDLFTKLIQASSRRSHALSATFVHSRERWLTYLQGLSMSRMFLMPIEKVMLARAMCIESLIIFTTCIVSPLFRDRLLMIASIFYPSDTPEESAARLICDLFQKYSDTPDTWLSRVSTLHHVLAGIAGTTVGITQLEQLIEM